LLFENISVYGNTPLKLVLLRIVTVLGSVVVSLFAAAYASAPFNYETSSGLREGTPITAIVFMSVFIALFVFLVATGAWLLHRKYPTDTNRRTDDRRVV
jgi:hypothetical protein